MKTSTQRKIFENYKAGKETVINRFKYSIQYNPLAAVHTWIIRSPKNSETWEFLQPLAIEIK
jgi:hypothetical protein|nr:MAG TPA: hypothetical protein [Caudoviricetes sp.]